MTALFIAVHVPIAIEVIFIIFYGHKYDNSSKNLLRKSEYISHIFKSAQYEILRMARHAKMANVSKTAAWSVMSAGFLLLKAVVII